MPVVKVESEIHKGSLWMSRRPSRAAPVLIRSGRDGRRDIQTITALDG